MVPAVLHRVCYQTAYPESQKTSLLTFTDAILHAHTRHKVRYCDFPAVTPSSPHSSVRGTYVCGLTDDNIRLLDTFEGTEYERQRVRISLLAGDEAGVENGEVEEVETETYIWVGGEDSLEEGEWDFSEFKREKLRDWIFHDEHYNGRLRLSLSDSAGDMPAD